MRTTRSEIEQIVKQAIAKSTGIDAMRIAPHDNLIEDLDMDSLSVFEVAIDLEEYYGVQIEDEALDKIYNVEDIINYIEHYGSKD